MWIYFEGKDKRNEYIINIKYYRSIWRMDNKIEIYPANKRSVGTIADFKSADRAKEVFSDLMRAITDGKNLFIMPTE